MPASAPEYGVQSRMAAHSTATLHRQQRPYSMAGPGFPQQVSLPQYQHPTKICPSAGRMRLCGGGGEGPVWMGMDVAGIT